MITNVRSQMTLQWILVYRQPARTRVVRNLAIGGTSRPEGSRVGVGGGYILGLSHKWGGNFLKYPFPGRGKFFICLNCLKITDPPLRDCSLFMPKGGSVIFKQFKVAMCLRLRDCVQHVFWPVADKPKSKTPPLFH